MSRLRIHLEPVGAMGTQLEVGQLQRARHRNRPLLTGCGSYRHGLATAETSPDGLRLHCRDAEDARRAAVLAGRALASLAPLQDLLVARPGDRATVEGCDLRIETALPTYLVHRLLDSVKALPADHHAGDPVPDTVDFVEYTGPDAIAAFERGELQATAPTSFEIARDCRTDARFRPYQLDLFALLLIGPRLSGRHSLVSSRRILRDRLAAEPVLAGLLAVAEDDEAPEPAHVGGGADLLYADFWPNAAIVRSLCAALESLGCTARPRRVPLGELHSRTSAGDFDLALVLANGYAGPQLSIPLTLARSTALTHPAAGRSAAALAPLRDALAAALAGPEGGPAWRAVTAAALQHVPAVPLGRLHGGSLVDPALPDHPPAYGCVLPLEHYAGGCDA